MYFRIAPPVTADTAHTDAHVLAAVYYVDAAGQITAHLKVIRPADESVVHRRDVGADHDYELLLQLVATGQLEPMMAVDLTTLFRRAAAALSADGAGASRTQSADEPSPRPQQSTRRPLLLERKVASDLPAPALSPSH